MLENLSPPGGRELDALNSARSIEAIEGAAKRDRLWTRTDASRSFCARVLESDGRKRYLRHGEELAILRAVLGDFSKIAALASPAGRARRIFCSQ